MTTTGCGRKTLLQRLWYPHADIYNRIWFGISHRLALDVMTTAYAGLSQVGLSQYKLLVTTRLGGIHAVAGVANAYVNDNDS